MGELKGDLLKRSDEGKLDMGKTNFQRAKDRFDKDGGKYFQKDGDIKVYLPEESVVKPGVMYDIIFEQEVPDQEKIVHRHTGYFLDGVRENKDGDEVSYQYRFRNEAGGQLIYFTKDGIKYGLTRDIMNFEKLTFTPREEK